jgi:hypothetical protein
LRILPKSMELLTAMEAMAIEARARDARHFEPKVRGDKDEDQDPAGAFVRALLGCVSEGIPWHYGSRTSPTSFPRGKLAFRETVRSLAPRGIKHQVITTTPTRIQDLRIVRVVRAAHGCLANVPAVTQEMLANAETLISAFDLAEPFANLEQAIVTAKSCLTRSNGEHPAAAELIVRSLEVLSREYAAAGVICPVPGGLARFRNLEELWERCVLRLVNCSPTLIRDSAAQFHGLIALDYRLFSDGGPKLDPDIVSFHGDRVFAIVDAKYKRMGYSESASAEDLYQLTAYVRRTSAHIGILVYFATDSSKAELVGTTPEGALVIVISLSAELLLSERENALEKLLARSAGARKRIDESFADDMGQARRNGISDLPGDVFFGA